MRYYKGACARARGAANRSSKPRGGLARERREDGCRRPAAAWIGARLLLAVFTFALCIGPLAPRGAAAPLPTALRIAFVDLSLPKDAETRNAAALAFARTQGEAIRLKPTAEGGWQDASGRLRAPEEADVVWYHQGEAGSPAAFGRAGTADLLAYVEAGGVVLLSGAAGSLLNEMGVESTPLRLLAPTEAAYASGIRVVEKHHSHPAFEGLNAAETILLTSKGGNALADFYGTAGPHGDLLAEGNAGLGERPLVEYPVGAGRVILVGWRLPDFTTAGDSHRPNLERLFGNLLRYLAGRNTNHARLVVPPGEHRYERLLGVPFLRAAKPAMLTAPASGARYAAVLTGDNGMGDGYRAGQAFVRETPVQAGVVSSQALGLTLLEREKPVSRYVTARRDELTAFETRDKELMRGLRVVKPTVSTTPAPLKPLVTPETNRSVLLGRSPYMAPGDGKGDVTPVYEPVEDGGFRIAGSTRRLNRPIVHGQNRIWTGDVPVFRMDTVTGNGSYAREERVFPLWPRPDAHVGNVNPCLGSLRLGVAGLPPFPPPRGGEGGEAAVWLDALPGTIATFRPGYTEYQVADAAAGWKAIITVAPLMASHGMVCRVEFDREVPLVWQYGGVWWQASEANKNKVVIAGGTAQLTEPNLPNGLVAVGWDGGGEGKALDAPYGQQVEFTAAQGRRTYHIVATWGVTGYDEDRAQKTMDRLDTPASAGWVWARDILKRRWFDCYIGRALKPELRLQAALLAPGEALRKTREWWDGRRGEFQVKTPDAHLNALVNWARCTSEYHRQGPGLVLGAQIWQMYSHISTGWYGKEWAGDHQALDECLRLYAAMQGEDGFINWVSPSLVAFHAENNTPYWVDQVWQHYAWTGDKQFVRELWPQVRKAVSWQCKRNDPDGDGLFRDAYEYWNCDSNGKGPKAAAASAMSWAMLDRAARMAGVVGDAKAEGEYRLLAERTRQAIFRELWREDAGRLGSIGADELWRGHPQTWEEYLAANAGLLDAAQSRRAMRWLESHYGFEPAPGVRLLACSDWWPIRWSVQWVPTGDTCLAALAGMRSGDADLWWPYLKTVVLSSFKSEFPGINMGISNAGAGGGDREDVDSVDPHLHVTVRGLFGIEPALHEGRIDICPAFPSDWREASIRTPDVSYEYRREGSQATFTIRTPKPVVKRVRAYPGGRETVTPAETESVVTVPVAAAPPPPPAGPKPQVLVDRGAPAGAGSPPDPPKLGGTGGMAAAPAVSVPAATPAAPLTPQSWGERGAWRSRQVLFDLAGACNVTLEEITAMRFQFDYSDGLSPLSSWWGNPTLTLQPSSRIVEVSTGVRFLTGGRPHPSLGYTPKNLLALSSWPPYPLPAGASIPVMQRCERLWLLLQSYVHPMKNYIPNGEVVLRYADGTRKIVSLVPPYNLDCYFQHFSLEGMPVPFGALGGQPLGWSPIHAGMASAHADVLAVESDPTRLLEAVELRATCSEGVLGLAGMTALAVPE